jgi:cell division septation protein DedD
MVENEDGSVKKVGDDELKKESSAPHVKKFYVVAGSFKNINNAVELRQFFKKSGYPAMILYPYNGYNRVATGSFPDRASAEKEVKKFRSMNLTYESGKIEYWLLWR